MAGLMSRCSGAVLSVAVVALLAGCGAVMNSAVVGVPSGVSPGAVRSAADPPVGARLQSILAELNEAAATPGGPESPQLLAALSALGNDHALINAEKSDVLKQFAATQIGQRQAVVSTLIASVQGRPRLNPTQRASVLANLGGMSARLTNLGSVIAAEPLVDRLRAEIGQITPLAQIYGAVQPLNHKAAP